MKGVKGRIWVGQNTEGMLPTVLQRTHGERLLEAVNWIQSLLNYDTQEVLLPVHFKPYLRWPDLMKISSQGYEGAILRSISQINPGVT